MQQAIEKLRRENDELRQANLLSTDVLDALRSDHQVPTILGLLQDQEDLVLIADVASKSPQRTKKMSSLGFPFTMSLGLQEEICAGSDPETVAETDKNIGCWTSAPRNQLLIKHLLSLYWTWIHPARPLFNMGAMVQRLMAGNEGPSSIFLVAAVCAAACDLLTPGWSNMLAQDTDIATLKGGFVAEANRQGALADDNAQATCEALQVMKTVNLRSMAASARSASTSDGMPGLDLNEQMLPDIEQQKIMQWLDAVDDIPGSCTQVGPGGF